MNRFSGKQINTFMQEINKSRPVLLSVTNLLLAVLTIGTKGADPAAQPPTASKTFSRGFRLFNARVRSYNPANRT